MTPARSAPVLANTSEPVERLEVDVDATTAAYLRRRCVPAVTWPAPQPQSCTTSPCATRPPRSPATTSRAKPSCWSASRTPTQPSPSWRPEYARADDHLTPTRRCQGRCRGRHDLLNRTSYGETKKVEAESISEDGALSPSRTSW